MAGISAMESKNMVEVHGEFGSESPAQVGSGRGVGVGNGNFEGGGMEIETFSRVKFVESFIAINGVAKNGCAEIF